MSAVCFTVVLSKHVKMIFGRVNKMSVLVYNFNEHDSWCDQSTELYNKYLSYHKWQKMIYRNLVLSKPNRFH